MDANNRSIINIGDWEYRISHKDNTAWITKGTTGGEPIYTLPHMYDLGACTFCQLCVSTCPHNAIEFTNEFEQAVFSREKLVKQLNNRPETATPKNEISE